jgi:hypothetical protein
VGATGRTAVGKDRDPDRGTPDRIRAELVATLARYRDALVVADRAVRIALLDVEAGTHPGFPGHDHLAAIQALVTAARRCRGVVLGFGRLLAVRGDLPIDLPDDAATTDAGAWEACRTGAALLRQQEATARVTRQLADEPEPYAGRAHRLLDPTVPPGDTRASDGADAVADLAAALADPALFAFIRAVDELLERRDAGAAGRAVTVDDLIGGLTAAFAGLTAALRHAGIVDGAPPEALQPTTVERVADAAAVFRAALEAVVEPLGDDAAVLAAGVEEIEESAEEYLATRRAGVLLAELSLRPAADGAAGFVLGRLHAFEEAFALGAADDLRDAWHRVLDASLTARLGTGG